MIVVQPDGSYKKVSVPLGTVAEFGTAPAAWMKAGAHRVHAESQKEAGEQVTSGAVCNRYNRRSNATTSCANFW